MRLDERLMPRVLRGRLARERDQRARRRTRQQRIAGSAVLVLMALGSGSGCLVGAVGGGLATARRGLFDMLLGAASGAMPTSVIGFGAGLLAAVIVGGGAALAFSSSRAVHERISQQLTFVIELLDAIEDDLMPGRKVGVLFDTEGLTEGKRTRLGRSVGGRHSKERFVDRWLELHALLVDGSKLRVRMRADVKTKYSSRQILKVKRWLWLSIEPGRAVRFDPAEVEDAAEEAIASSFHDPPERVRVSAHVPSGSSEIRVKVMQLDAGILPGEVVALASAVLASAHGV